jgi:hypothetical protein
MSADELAVSRELVDAQGSPLPCTPGVQLQQGAAVVTDGPYPETQEVLAGYTVSSARA